jgi:folate-binding protein YgfZ
VNVLIDLSARVKLRLTGADRVRFLNGQVSNDVRLATADASVYTCVMTIKGKMCADAFVHAREDALWLDAEPSVRESLPPRLERYLIADDVLLEDVSEDFGLLHWLPEGDLAAALETARGVEGGWALQSTRFGRPGIDFFADAAGIATLAQCVGLEALAPDSAAVEALRIQAGVPRWGAELDENTMPAEAGIEDRAVSYTKGCYLGQEIVSRVRSVGHVNRHLRGLRSIGVLRPGDLLFHAEREAGRVTSATSDPADPARGSIALAFVRRGWDVPGTELSVRPAAPHEPGDAPPATVCSLPFS